MPLYTATFRSGAQQVFEMDVESAHELGADLQTHRRYWDSKDRGGFTMPESTMPPSVFLTDTGAVIDLAELAGFQHYISMSRATIKEWEDREEG
jgi:hypothetical protein